MSSGQIQPDKMIKKIIHKICENPIGSNFIRIILEAGMVNVKKNAISYLEPKRDESVIDVGCGTGEFSVIIPGKYTGIDADQKHIAYARKKYGGENKGFYVMDGSKLGYRRKSFDKAMFINCLHHVDDDLFDKILCEIGRVTKKRILIIDTTPLNYNLFGMLTQKLDQGRYIRSIEEQLKLVRKRFKVKSYKTFRSGVNIHSLVVIDL